MGRAGRNYTHQPEAGWVGAAGSVGGSRCEIQTPMPPSLAQQPGEAVGQLQPVPGGWGSAGGEAGALPPRVGTRANPGSAPRWLSDWVAAQGSSASGEVPQAEAEMWSNPAGKAGCYSAAQSSARAECETLIKLRLGDMPLVSHTLHTPARRLKPQGLLSFSLDSIFKQTHPPP